MVLKSRAAIFVKGVRGNVVSGFASRDLTAAQIKCEEGTDQKDVVIRSAYFRSDSVKMPAPTEFEELVMF